MGFKHIIFKTFKDFGEKTSIAGLSNAFNAESKAKSVYWMFLFIIGSGLTFYGIVDTLVSYFKYDVLTSTDVLYATTIEMPAVSICNLNR